MPPDGATSRASADAEPPRAADLSDDDLLAALAEAVDDDAGSAPGVGGEGVPGYELRREIHRGAQGVVYEAWHPRTKRLVAVKVLLGGAFATSGERERFAREAELVASISHPGVVTVHDSGTTGEGRGYLVMELVDGRPLDAWADERRPAGGGRRGWREALEVLAGACEAVQAAHRRGIIHRDLKPSNVLVDQDGRPRVLDFGTAKLTPGEGRAALRTLTQDGGFVGSIAYAAPEQLRGGAAAADTRSDVYALGVMLYRVLAGRHPLDLEASLPDVVAAASRGIETPPSRFAPGLVDGELDAIALRAVEADPERRYPSAQALADDLRRYLAGEPVEARRASGWYRARVFVRRHRVLVGSAVAFWTLVTAFGSGMAVLYAREKRARSAAETAFGTVFHTLEATDRERPDGGPRVATLKEFLDEASRLVDESLAAHPLARADAQARIGRAYLSREEHERGLEVLRRVLEVRRRELGGRHPLVAEALEDVGRALWDTDGFEQAAESYRAALEIRLAHAPRAPQTGATMHHLAATLNRLGRYDEAERLYERAIPILEAGMPETGEQLASALNSYGVLLRHIGRVREATAAAERALAIVEQSGGAEDWRVSRALSSLAAYLTIAREWDRAEAALRRAIEINDRLSGAGDADTATLLGRLARLNLDRAAAVGSEDGEAGGDRGGGGGGGGGGGNPAWLATAEASSRRALEIRERLFPDPHPQIAEALGLRGQVRLARGDAPGAVEDLRRAESIYRRLLPEDTWEVARTRVKLGEALAAAGRVGEGIDLTRRSAATLERVLGPDHRSTREAREALARLEELGRS